MALIKPILKNFDQPSCYFFQKDKCILSHPGCLFCNLRINKIDGIDKPEQYLSFVTTRNINSRNFYFAFFAFLFSLITLAIKLLELMKTPGT